jgi:hypothetical protein
MMISFVRYGGYCAAEYAASVAMPDAGYAIDTDYKRTGGLLKRN